jgi:hypothetical protein
MSKRKPYDFRFGEYIVMDDLRGGRMVFAVSRDETKALAVTYSNNNKVDVARVAPWPIHPALQPQGLGLLPQFIDSELLGGYYLTIIKSLMATAAYQEKITQDALFMARLMYELSCRKKNNAAFVLDKGSLKDMIETVEEQNRYAVSVYNDLQAFQQVAQPLAEGAV